MLSRSLTVAALSAVLFSSPGFAPAAQAEDLAFHFGGEFRLGRVSFHLGVLARGSQYHDHYFRTRHALRYDGYSCSRACYRRGDHDFHHHSCPVVQRHFELSRVRAWDVYDRWAPRWDDRHGSHHYDRRSEGRRYDDRRYDDRRYDDRRYDDRRYEDRRHDHRRYEGRRHDDRRRGHDCRRSDDHRHRRGCDRHHRH